jgi:hypothetical protein
MTRLPEAETALADPEANASTTHKSTNTLRQLLSTRKLLIYVALLLIFAGAAQPITDRDFWWHLKTGQYIVDTRTIPHTDIFSSVRFGSEWITHEWLSEVFIYGIFRALGFPGLIIFFALIVTAAFGISYLTCRARSVPPVIAAFAILLGAFATMLIWGVRPQMFSLLLASIFLYVLDRYARGGRVGTLWWLVPLTVLWANLHAGFALGPTLIVVTVLGLSLEALLSRGQGAVDWRRIRLLVLVLIICVLAVSLNPNGLRLYSYPFETLNSSSMMQYIQEWRSPNFHDPRFLGLALLLLACLFVFALSNRRPRLHELLLLLVTAWGALHSGRNIPFFALVAIPLVAEHLWNWIGSHPAGKLTLDEENIKKDPFIKLAINGSLMLVVTVLIVLGVYTASREQAKTEVEQFPAAATDFVKAQSLPQPIFNDYDWGGYIIWRLYPEYKVYIDGRADVYGDQIMVSFFNAYDGKAGWSELLDRDGIQTVMIKPNVPLASLLRVDSSNWTKMYEDKQAVIFIRK